MGKRRTNQEWQMLIEQSESSSLSTLACSVFIIVLILQPKSVGQTETFERMPMSTGDFLLRILLLLRLSK